MSTAYTPRPGSVAERAITHLRTLAPRAELSGAALAEAIGVDPNVLAPSLAAAAERGTLHRRQKGGHARSPAFWSLSDHGGAAAPLPPPHQPRPRRAVDEHADMPVRQIIRPANGAPPLPIVAPLFPPLVATEHAVPESFTAGQRVSSRDLVEPPADTSAAPAPAFTQPQRADFRCGLFSDGEFVLSANGQTLTLDREQTRQLAHFFDRIVTEAA